MNGGKPPFTLSPAVPRPSHSLGRNMPPRASKKGRNLSHGAWRSGCVAHSRGTSGNAPFPNRPVLSRTGAARRLLPALGGRHSSAVADPRGNRRRRRSQTAVYLVVGLIVGRGHGENPEEDRGVEEGPRPAAGAGHAGFVTARRVVVRFARARRTVDQHDGTAAGGEGEKQAPRGDRPDAGSPPEPLSIAGQGQSQAKIPPVSSA